MSESNAQAQNHCPYCIKDGLPILPVRYAIADNSEGVKQKAPKLQAPFGEGVQNIPLAADSAIYTLRLMRNGYLYVFNEVLGPKKGWKAYQVNQFGELREFAIDAAAPPQNHEAQPAVCSRIGHAELSKCIVIPYAKKAKILRLTFSTTAWTQEVWKQYRDNSSYREEHMRQIDVGAWANTAESQPHLQGFDLALNQIAECFLARNAPSDRLAVWRNGKAAPQCFISSLSDYLWIGQSGFKTLEMQAKQAAGSADPKTAMTPAIVALDDPVGIAADLNQLALERLMNWANEPERKEQYETAHNLIDLREAVKNGAVKSEEQRRKDIATSNDMIQQGMSEVAPPERNWDDPYFKVTDEDEIRRLGEKAWKKYSSHLRGDDGNACEEYLKNTWPEEFQDFGSKAIVPLDKTLVAWMGSDKFKNHFICNFDPKNIDSGIEYQETMAVILQDALRRITVIEHAWRCLQDDPSNPTCVVMRAFAWNQDKAIEKWKELVAALGKPEISWKDIFDTSSSLYEAWKQIMGAAGDANLEGAFKNLAKFVENFSSPLTRMVGESLEALANKTALQIPQKMQLGLLMALFKADKPDVAVINLRGMTTDINARNGLVSEIARRAGVNASGAAKAAAGKDGKPIHVNLIVLTGKKDIETLPHLKAAIQAASANSTIETQEFAALLRQSIGNITKDAPFGYGVVSTIFAGASLGLLYKEYAKAQGAERQAMTMKFGIGLAGLLGASAETVGELGKHLPWFSQGLQKPLGRWAFNASTKAQLFVAAGRWLGTVAGVLVGFAMIADGAKDWALNGYYGFGMVFGGIATAISALLLLIGPIFGLTLATPFGIFFFILGIAASFTVIWITPDELERWLDKVRYFGRNANGKFPRLEDQINAAKAILKAERPKMMEI